MPRELLDRPRHKIDFGIRYMDEKTGWSGSLWADYYLNMLDSNSVDMSKQAEAKRAADYKRKSFGIWNLMVQKKFGEDAMAYIGVDNLFAKRDDDRAFQGRVYRLGMNFSFDSAGGSAARMGTGLLSSSYRSDWFIQRDTKRCVRESSAFPAITDCGRTVIRAKRAAAYASRTSGMSAMRRRILRTILHMAMRSACACVRMQGLASIRQRRLLPARRAAWTGRRTSLRAKG